MENISLLTQKQYFFQMKLGIWSCHLVRSTFMEISLSRNNRTGFLKTGSKWFLNISPIKRKQYFLSNKISQLFGQTSLSEWRSEKYQEQKTVLHGIIALTKSLQDVVVLKVMYLKNDWKIPPLKIGQYFLSSETSQADGCASFDHWNSWKKSLLQNSRIWQNMANSLRDINSIEVEFPQTSTQ